MTDKEILREVYATCKREPDVGSGEIVNIIEQEWERREQKVSLATKILKRLKKSEGE